VKISLLQTKRKDWTIIIPVAIIFFSSLLVALWDFVTFQGMVFRANIVTVAGLVLFLIGIVIRQVGKKTLGKYYSYGLRTLENHQLIKHGIYKYIRHPISLAAIMYSIGVPLIFLSLIGFFLMVMIIPFILYRVEIEERMLVEKFGDEYREYMKVTKKLIPFVY
jgi:protein-S-isoprenylcysteine O-methyltransferase Ste14